MGLGDREAGNRVYLRLYGGKIVQEWRNTPPEEVPSGKKLEERVTDKGNKIYYVSWDSLTGHMESAFIKEGTGGFKDELVIVISSDGMEFRLSMTLTGSYGNDIIRKFPNINRIQQVTFEPWTMTPAQYKKKYNRDVEKDQRGMWVRQNDQNVTHYYTSENGYPELEKRKKGKSFTWDGSKRETFLYEKLEEFIETLNEPLF